MEVVVNAAMSVDGKLSTRDRRQVAISGPTDFARLDHLRSSADAVMVGVGTVLADDPHLTIEDDSLRERRLSGGRSAHPTRVVADSTGRTPPDARILDDVARTIVLVTEDAPPERVVTLRDAATVVSVGTGRVDLAEALTALSAEGIGRLMVEGGGELVFSLFEAELVDELTVFVGNVVIGGRDAPTLVDGDGFASSERFPSLRLDGIDRVDDGVLLEWSVRRE